MKSVRVKIACAAAAALFGLTGTAPALVNLDGTKNQIFVSAGATFAWDSNIYAERAGRGDFTTSASGTVEFKRRAGIIAVNGSMAMNLTRFIRYSEESSTDPTFALVLNKSTGKTTGELTVNAFRESRSDSAVNIRTQSWNFPVGFSLKYPVSDRFYLTSATGYHSRRYVNNDRLANLADISEGVNVFYVFTSKLDLMGGYRVRVSDTSIDTRSLDHAFTLGATGGLLAKMNGTFNVGLQVRRAETGETFVNYTTSSSFTWNASRKFNMTAQFSRDFATTASASTVDSFSAVLRATFVLTRKFEVNSGAGYGSNHFLGKNAPHRADQFVTFDAGARYSLNEHFTVNGNYTFLHNWSNVQFSVFTRNGFSLSVSSRY